MNSYNDLFICINLINNFVIYSIHNLLLEFQSSKLCVVFTWNLFNLVLETMEKFEFSIVCLYSFPFAESTMLCIFVVCFNTFNLRIFIWTINGKWFMKWNNNFFSCINLINNFVIDSIYNLLLKFQSGELSVVFTWNLFNLVLESMEKFNFSTVCLYIYPFTICT